MTLSTSITLPRGATITLTGGTTTTFVNDGRGTGGAKVLVDTSNNNFSLRGSITTRLASPAHAPTVNQSAKLGRANLVVHTPYVDAAGRSYKQADQVTLSFHPDLTVEQIQAKRLLLVAAIMDPEMDDFFLHGIHN